MASSETLGKIIIGVCNTGVLINNISSYYRWQTCNKNILTRNGIFTFAIVIYFCISIFGGCNTRSQESTLVELANVICILTAIVTLVSNMVELGNNETCTIDGQTDDDACSKVTDKEKCNAIKGCKFSIPTDSVQGTCERSFITTFDILTLVYLIGSLGLKSYELWKNMNDPKKAALSQALLNKEKEKRNAIINAQARLRKEQRRGQQLDNAALAAAATLGSALTYGAGGGGGGGGGFPRRPAAAPARRPTPPRQPFFHKVPQGKKSKVKVKVDVDEKEEVVEEKEEKVGEVVVPGLENMFEKVKKLERERQEQEKQVEWLKNQMERTIREKDELVINATEANKRAKDAEIRAKLSAAARERAEKSLAAQAERRAEADAYAYDIEQYAKETRKEKNKALEKAKRAGKKVAEAIRDKKKALDEASRALASERVAINREVEARNNIEGVKSELHEAMRVEAIAKQREQKGANKLGTYKADIKNLRDEVREAVAESGILKKEADVAAKRARAAEQKAEKRAEAQRVAEGDRADALAWLDEARQEETNAREKAKRAGKIVKDAVAAQREAEEERAQAQREAEEATAEALAAQREAEQERAKAQIAEEAAEKVNLTLVEETAEKEALAEAQAQAEAMALAEAQAAATAAKLKAAEEEKAAVAAAVAAEAEARKDAAIMEERKKLMEEIKEGGRKQSWRCSSQLARYSAGIFYRGTGLCDRK